MTTSFDVEKLYSKLELGSSTLNEDLGLPFPETINYFGFKQESFNLGLKSNIDKSIDLRGEWIRSSNVISACIKRPTPDTSNDDNIIILDTIVYSANYGRTRNVNFLNVSPARYYFNERLTNRAIADRLIGGLPANITKYIAPAQDNTFKALRTALAQVPVQSLGGTLHTYAPLRFAGEVSDPNNNYDTSTSRYTAPATGVYRFKSDITAIVNDVINPNDYPFNVYWRAVLRHYDSGGSIIETRDMFTPNSLLNFENWYRTSHLFITNNEVLLQKEESLVMNQGDYCDILFERRIYGSSSIVIDDYEIYDTSYFRCLSDTSGGGEYNTYDPKEFPAYKASAKFPMTRANYDKFAKNRFGKVTLSDAFNNSFTGWIENSKYDRLTGMLTLNLISKSNIK